MAVDGAAPGVLHLQRRVAEMLSRCVPCSCQRANTPCIRPVAPTGCPQAIRPPEGLTGQTGVSGKLQAVIDARHEGFARGGEGPAFAVAAQAQVFVGLDLAGGVGVVQLDEIQLVQRVGMPAMS